MRLDLPWSLRGSAALLAGLLGLTVGCSSPPDKNAGSADAASGAKPATAGENPAEPAISSESLPASGPDLSVLPSPTLPVGPDLVAPGATRDFSSGRARCAPRAARNEGTGEERLAQD